MDKKRIRKGVTILLEPNEKKNRNSGNDQK